MKNAIELSFVVTIVAILLYGCSKKDDVSATEEVKPPVVVVDNVITATTKKIMDNSTVIKTFVADTTIKIAEGLSQTTITYNRADKLPVKFFILEADLKNDKLDIQALSPYNDLLFGLQPIGAMAKDNEVAGTKIMAAINGGAYNTTTGEPTGVFYVNAIGVKTTIPTGGTFFSVYNDKSVKMGGKDTKGVLRTIDYTRVKSAVGGTTWLVDNGVKAGITDVTVDSRTAIGYTSTSVVYAVMVDGKPATYSNGMSLTDLRDVIAALGVVDAIVLDGGNSTTFVVRDAAAANWNTLNKPGLGYQRSVGNGLGFVVKN